MTNIIDIISEESAYAREQSDREEAYRRKVISAFMEYGRIKSIPAQRKKEHILLEEIAKAFEYGREYTEREVNLIIADFYADFCTLRRDMIGDGLLTRKDGVYRKVNQESL